MKAFKIDQDGEKFIVAADTNLGALRHLMMEMEWTIDLDFNGSEEINEIPESEWDEVTIRNTEYDPTDPESKKEYSLRETVEGLTDPYFIGSSIFD